MTRAYECLNFHGAVGFTDVTNVQWDMAPYMEAVHYNGKEGVPSIAYEVTVDHTRFVQRLTAGFPGAKNDKTIIRFDKLITKIRSKDKHTHTMVGAEGTKHVQRGAYVYLDGGYHKWGCTICLMKTCITQEQRNWSDQLESVQKDVECFFGRITSRWRILKLPLQFHTGEAIDQIFITCYILQNIFHAWDRLDQLEGDGDWIGGSEMHDQDVCDLDLDLCQEGMMDNSPAPGSEQEVEGEAEFYKLRAKTIEHFSYKKQRNLVEWVTSSYS
ncbi:unnamed protein product [Discosporangium mesarthrocarpum]